MIAKLPCPGRHEGQLWGQALLFLHCVNLLLSGTFLQCRQLVPHCQLGLHRLSQPVHIPGWVMGGEFMQEGVVGGE
ncbi:hypothetical protein E2C01_036846 [Portunus trituberculatus]|uniref:Uncharacterized protein n=1 Tax=Portunus trituberculatus TaxID=210409 RepID=A0A5B7FD29_PORTR|nr:hypothetical protein [Portunus trituberculatus]